MKEQSIVLCEGETDQIILSYYFEKLFHYHYASELPKILNVNPQAEFVRLYMRSEDKDEVVIWAIGGRNLFRDALNEVLEANMTNAESVYSKVLVILDHDSDRETKQIWDQLDGVLNSFGIDATFSNDQWTTVEQKIEFGDPPIPLKLLGLAIPQDEDGALETFLLKALSEQEGNKYLAEQSKKFVHDLLEHQEELNSYLSKKGLQVKAPLAVFFAIASPHHIFREMKAILKSVSWEKYKTIQTGFKLLDEAFAYK